MLMQNLEEIVKLDRIDPAKLRLLWTTETRGAKRAKRL